MRSSIVSVIMADWESWRGDGRLCQIGTSRENTRQTQGGITILTVAHIKVTFMQIAVFMCSPRRRQTIHTLPWKRPPACPTVPRRLVLPQTC